MEYQRDITVKMPFQEAVARVRQALAEQGFGVLTEIDMQATLRAKLGLAMEEYIILGACNPALAQRALEVDPAVGVLLPCNVVVSAADGGARVRMFDPTIIPAVTGLDELRPIADEVSQRVQAVLDAVAEPAG